jgi:hypothetical protein
MKLPWVGLVLLFFAGWAYSANTLYQDGTYNFNVNIDSSNITTSGGTGTRNNGSTGSNYSGTSGGNGGSGGSGSNTGGVNSSGFGNGGSGGKGGTGGQVACGGTSTGVGL